KQPYQFRDKEFGMVNLRLFGEFRYKVSSPENFVNQFVGTLNFATSAEVEERIKEQMVVLVYDSLGDMKKDGLGVADIASNLTTIEQIVLARCKDHFDQYGLTVDKMSGMYISLPEEVQNAVDTRSSMQILGANYVQYQTGQAMREAAQNPEGGTAGAGVGVGAGIGMGWTMMDSMRQQPQQGGPPQSTTQQVNSISCPKCGAANPPSNKFCSECGASMMPEKMKCSKCSAEVDISSKFCSECGTQMADARKCASCGAVMTASSKFCPECGKEA
ncbi:MAG: SPFH domain-containing protein, partial [Methanobacteriota archaeon]